MAGGSADVSFPGRAVSRLIITENDLCPARQRRNAANGILNVSFLVFAWNDDRDGKVFQRNVSLNHSREDNLRHAEFAQKWQARVETIQKPDSRGKYFGKER